jgi:shikimate kinase/3-dehydroquinate synthase
MWSVATRFSRGKAPEVIRPARHVVLIGLPGAGKTAVGEKVAVRLGMPFVDLDAAFARTQGVAAAEALRREGEAAFRIREAEVLGDVLGGPPAVIASGGGTPCFHSGMERMASAGTVVWLAALPGTLAARTLHDGDRPLLGTTRAEQQAALQHLHEERSPVFARAAVRVDATRAPDEVAAAVALALQPRAERLLQATDVPTRIVVHGGHAWDAAGDLAQLARGRRIALVVDTKVQAQGLALRDGLHARGIEAASLTVPGGERSKDLRTCQRVWEWLQEEGFSRHDLLVGLGGGATTDLAGFAAATWQRGMRLCLLPTTVLAMADAAVGGKTALNLTGNKNSIGAFWHPELVHCGLATLDALPAREFRAGLAEIAKIFLALDADAWRALADDAARLRHRDTQVLLSHLVRAQSLKADVVAADPAETAGPDAPLPRKLLNLGHTLGHALEAEAPLQLRHGEAVALGLVAAAEVSETQGWAQPGLGAEVRTVLAALGLPVAWEPYATPAALDRVQRDKKRTGDSIAFVTLQGVGQARIEPCAVAWLRGILEVLASVGSAPPARRTGSAGTETSGTKTWRQP